MMKDEDLYVEYEIKNNEDTVFSTPFKEDAYRTFLSYYVFIKGYNLYRCIYDMETDKLISQLQYKPVINGIAGYRSDTGLSERSLARLSNVPVAVLRNYENDPPKLNSDNAYDIQRIAKTLERDMLDLVLMVF